MNARKEQKAEDHLVRKVEAQLRGDKCAYCGNITEGNFSIHRDGLGEGPEVPLCNRCGGRKEPTEAQIWARIGQSQVCLSCDEPILSGDARQGSFHDWCR